MKPDGAAAACAVGPERTCGTIRPGSKIRVLNGIVSGSNRDPLGSPAGLLIELLVEQEVRVVQIHTRVGLSS